VGGERDKSIFVNCPFDKRYRRLFDALVFAIAFCGFDVRSALEESNSADVRLLKIMRLLQDSRYSIHDISRVELDPNTKLPRFNMPLELGAAIGLRGLRHAAGDKADHRLLILDAKAYRYQTFVSDLAGVDIKGHGNQPKKLIQAVRDFLNPCVDRHLPGPAAIYESYSLFEETLPVLAREQRQKVAELTYIDRLRHLSAFLAKSR
jgi:hypothetical protein